MASLAGTTTRADVTIALSRLDAMGHLRSAEESRLDSLYAFLTDGASEHVRPLLDRAHLRAGRIAAAGGHNDASDTTAAHVFAADVVATLAAEGELSPADTRVAVGALAETCSVPLDAAAFDLFLRCTSSPILLELPPVVAAEIQLRLLLHLDVADQLSLWRSSGDGDVECVVAFGNESTDRRTRARAKAAIGGRTVLALAGRSTLRTAKIHRFGTVVAVVVARPQGDLGRDLGGYLDEVATALAPVLERELLLGRNLARERAITGKAENRLTRFGFDLHDGPVQDVLALGAETRELRDDVFPFVLESHRELVRGRFDDLIARLAELDRQLRETAHSLESTSIVSRPLAEILHREVDAFAERAGIERVVIVRGDPESLGASQRIAIFRAVQEALANVREHSGATLVEVRLRVRRATVDVRVTDNGQGFEVSRSLAVAAERGRLGLVGIGERMRMLGGTFEIDSRPGGPTTLRFSIPRWEPFEPVTGQR